MEIKKKNTACKAHDAVNIAILSLNLELTLPSVLQAFSEAITHHSSLNNKIPNYK